MKAINLITISTKKAPKKLSYTTKLALFIKSYTAFKTNIKYCKEYVI